MGSSSSSEAIRNINDFGMSVRNAASTTHRKPADRGIGYVPQDLGLFPTMTVRGHLEFALRIRRWPVSQINNRVAELSRSL